MSERHIEMFWRCSSCNHRNLGRHMVCQRCKNAKDGSEQYEMPEDTASAVTVTDEALLRMATSGPNWRCAYCESDQRALDGGCKNCGASAVDGTSTADSVPPPPELPTGKSKPRRIGCYILLGLALFCCCPAMIAGQSGSSSTTKEAAAATTAAKGPEWTRALQVQDVAWEHTVSVERYRLVDEEGFEEDRPEDALQVKAQGKRHHHDDQVLDGYQTVSYTERVQKGFTTETYRDKEACGEDCTTTPEKCKETCTSNKNGFATCKTTCTGGEKRCKTRYCSVTKTRKEPRYVDERRTRKEPRYRSVPRDATWYTWKAWRWTHERDVKAQGTTVQTHWPTDAELKPAKALHSGEKERDTREAKYTVRFHGDAAPAITYVPASLEEFQRYTPGSTHTLQQDEGKVSVVAPPAPAGAPAPDASTK
ncbi:hypothetical protein [Myxococcus sp. AS-1-15]|uniref:hypothetical protein n=1 Tax=Myxococcus sp. AS-1-15 TaxID=2874600 RepID=UPI001CBDF0B1|nr:hypothetical protein [Myxococcus sp. AS-1-15]MBZ4401426.1 hypothetical protein [Myxococcus sp. AS-1-15]